MKSRSLRLGLLLSSVTLLGTTSVAVASPSVTAAAPPVGESPSLEEIGHFTCAITVTTDDGNTVDNGENLGFSKFPLNVQMRITNTGSNTLAGITNRYSILHRTRATAPLPPTSEPATLAPGATLTRNFTVEKFGLDFSSSGDDYVRSIVEVDVENVYGSAGPNVRRKCEHRVELIGTPQ